MDDRQKMIRASDTDRQEVVDRLRTALDEGRLKMDEYLDRMGLASEAVTYGDLDPLYADLPESTSVARREPAPAPAVPPQAPPPAAAARHGLPTPLKVLWTIWGAVVAVNVVVWVLASATTAHLIYPWPVWVAGPWGAILLAVTFGVARIRRGNPPQGKRLPPGQA
ncbi:MAG: DUF1707 SHOCT-like domain-containing protein [Streptosporangiaceae bacterium]